MTKIRLHNSRTRKREDFTPLDRENVRMYVCGPTVYDRAHLGNARPVVVFDVLYRLLRHVYGEGHVTYVRNFTDVDDKINARAASMQAEGDTRPLNAIVQALSDKTIDWYHADMDALGALRPTHEPRATQFITQMIAMIDGLIAKGHAYEVSGHVLFDVRSYPDYGRLSGRSVDDMIAGARVEVAPYKRDPMDFVLWKPSDAGLPGWDSPWGRGRPGWHIECSAMSHELLGASFDIHAGGIDLQFPHHENEIAQSCCAYPDAGFANYWLHNEMVQVEGKKMSKSLGNFFTVRDLLDQGWPGEVIRFVMLSTHYRKPMDWTEEKAREAKETLDWWATTISVDTEVLAAGAALLQDTSFKIDDEISEALRDDLNTSKALARLKTLGRFIDNSAAFRALEGSLQFKHRLDFVLNAEIIGFPLVSLARMKREQGLALTQVQVKINATREKALAEKNFSDLDRLKSSLLAAGVEVRMSKDGVELIPGPDFDPAKLEALK